MSGLGIIEVKDRPARMGRNPATGAAVQMGSPHDLYKIVR
jgi:nucleoid DNA-binding protein